MKNKTKFYSMIPIYVLVLSILVICAVYGSKAVTVISENAPITGRKTIVIDAGHGGEDGGATSCTGVLESQINLEIALRLNDLMHLLGINTVMIRTTDTAIYTEGETIAAKKVSDLKERVRLVNNTENAILVSIHQNQFSDSRYSGAQVFYTKTPGSEELAKSMQTVFVKALNPGSNRQCKKADGVYLMKKVNCTAVLVECGFLSNAEEEAKLRAPDYQKKLCCVIATVCSKYLYEINSIA